MLELHQSCDGDWKTLLDSSPSVEEETDLDNFMVYASLFFSNIGNYYGYGGRKFIPRISTTFLASLAEKASPRAQKLLTKCSEQMLSLQPSSCDFPGQHTQSGYYPGLHAMTKVEVNQVDRFLESQGIGTSNTRITQGNASAGTAYTVLQASVAIESPAEIGNLENGRKVLLQNGDHRLYLSQICESLQSALLFVDNELQAQHIKQYIKHFTTGDIAPFKEAQTLWIQDRSPVVENVLGFVENYRDPAGTRGEFEGIVALVDKDATSKLTRMVEKSPTFIRELPWVSYYNEVGESMGPLESATFTAPDFTSIHGMCCLYLLPGTGLMLAALAYCSSIIFTGINLPNVCGHSAMSGIC